MKKWRTILFLAGISFAAMISPSLSADAKTVTGNITWYNGVGKVGYHGKILEEWDCATKIGGDNPPQGTKIIAKSNAKPSYQITVYKWDAGTMPSAVLDVSPTAFRALGFSTDTGVVAGQYTY
ncbi:hypothetical protein AXI59_18170 [Bacillus nakamurai]|uniref:RlpA-like protein double-psi beta-barrel domain-containing protein n=1 Tax=Bacillus nakamurai TaxID=1793963 RepID=A0A150F9H4_9BACI|nr:hypothetical protein [Bacillus nakamurai]KXZ17354.1 hypothetical protein AXI59_18170 [Bacillus nakamurai]KXZ20182.1 hypothetical protein AXI58_15405 [Bacillus nakamurai]MED1227397.1 hypothetical protein [Bacillus nakamurai]